MTHVNTNRADNAHEFDAMPRPRVHTRQPVSVRFTMAQLVMLDEWANGTSRHTTADIKAMIRFVVAHKYTQRQLADWRSGKKSASRIKVKR